MPLKDEDFLLKKDSQLDQLLRNLGVEIEEKPTFKDQLADQYELDMDALAELGSDHDAKA
ncbi:hypothetical protein [Vaginisenegalia massiliensis]|uniref:hypothetical protein n=1 Tax=Vaginisenegalia massiliensis TaxID=2058294 RepID=UPI000F53B0AF|nr:hypothetical protein [Vaginisenegalia massiliensis]